MIAEIPAPPVCEHCEKGKIDRFDPRVDHLADAICPYCEGDWQTLCDCGRPATVTTWRCNGSLTTATDATRWYDCAACADLDPEFVIARSK